MTFPNSAQCTEPRPNWGFFYLALGVNVRLAKARASSEGRPIQTFRRSMLFHHHGKIVG